MLCFDLTLIKHLLVRPSHKETMRWHVAKKMSLDMRQPPSLLDDVSDKDVSSLQKRWSLLEYSNARMQKPIDIVLLWIYSLNNWIIRLF